MHNLEKYITKWNLIPDGESLITQTSALMPVIYKNILAMLKIALVSEERVGGQLMLWWDGQGAARILKHDNNAFLMERAMGTKSLENMAKYHQDDQATQIICSVVAKLHTPNDKPLPINLEPLTARFKSLETAAAQHEGIFAQALATAHELLKAPQEIVALHGDIHHTNILDFGERGWLAIDAKGLLGERGFDYANLFCNPDKETALKNGRLQHQATVVAEEAGLDRTRLLKWILSYAGLSAAWHLEDKNDPELAIAVAEIVLAELTI